MLSYLMPLRRYLVPTVQFQTDHLIYSMTFVFFLLPIRIRDTYISRRILIFAKTRNNVPVSISIPSKTRIHSLTSTVHD